MRDESDLRDQLRRIDGRGYPAYKDLRGAWELGELTLFLDHVQGDPFAAPSKLRLRVPARAARLPEELFENRTRTLALADYLARRAADAIRSIGSRGGGSREGRGRGGRGGERLARRGTGFGQARTP